MNEINDHKSNIRHKHKLSLSNKRAEKLKQYGLKNFEIKEVRTPKIKTKGLTINPQGAAKAHMMRMMKEVRDLDKQVVICQIENFRRTFQADTSNDAKLSILENTLYIVDKNRQNFGKVKNMSSLEKNRIALNLLSSLRHKDQLYQEEKQKSINRKLKHSDNESNNKFASHQQDYFSISPQKPQQQSTLTLFNHSQNAGKSVKDNQQLKLNLGYTSVGNFKGGDIFHDRSRQNLQSKVLQDMETNFIQSMAIPEDSELKNMRSRKKNISISILKQKQNRVGDPLNNFGIMTLNNLIPYKKPVLKSTPVFVNAKGVMHDLEQNHGGLYSNKGSQKEQQMKQAQQVQMPRARGNSFISQTLKRVRSAKPSNFRHIILSQDKQQQSSYQSRPLSPSTNDASMYSQRNYYTAQGPLFSNTEVANQLKRQLYL